MWMRLILFPIVKEMVRFESHRHEIEGWRYLMLYKKVNVEPIAFADSVLRPVLRFRAVYSPYLSPSIRMAQFMRKPVSVN